MGVGGAGGQECAQPRDGSIIVGLHHRGVVAPGCASDRASGRGAAPDRRGRRAHHQRKTFLDELQAAAAFEEEVARQDAEEARRAVREASRARRELEMAASPRQGDLAQLG